MVLSRRSTKARRAARRRARDEALLAIPDGVPTGYHYDPWGRPCSLGTWAAWFQTRGPERIVAQLRLPNGYLVSTVWLGLDHGFGRGAPLLYESMVFSPSSGGGGGATGSPCARQQYPDRRAARLGHRALVAEWLKRPRLEIVR